jgi:uncharacterized protein YndB with AHSA1/START domain
LAWREVVRHHEAGRELERSGSYCGVEDSAMPTPHTGLTKDTAWQVGARRTLAVPAGEAWQLVTSPESQAAWLGPGKPIELVGGAHYQLDDGSSGEVRVVVDGSHVRLTWQPGDWPRPSTIQVRVIARGERSVIAFHQEHMPGPAEREQRRAHFAAALDELERLAQGSMP